MKIIIICLVLIFIVWTLYGYFASRVENTSYTVIENKQEYEIRLYPKHLVAQTVVSGDYDQSLNEGFKIVAGYIFGGNKKKQPIAMTAPVTLNNNESENIAMTAPVSVTGTEQGSTVSFAMPKQYTLETLPEPTDVRVKIVEVPEKKLAVIRFAGWRSSSKNQKKSDLLQELLKKDGFNIVSSNYIYAGYNAPFTPPWMTRNEVMIEIN